MGRKPCCDKIRLKRGPWTIEEDYKLINFILNNGIHCWRMVPKLAGLLRCGKSCRLRWVNYLRPDLKRGAFTEDEEDKIIRLHSSLGNRWSKIAAHFPGRTDNEIKNQWNTRIKKHMMQQLGPEPSTHKPPVVNSQEVTPQSPMEQEMIDDSGKIEIIPAAMDDTTDELFQNDYESLWENNNNNNNNNKTTSTSCSKSSFSWEDTSMGSSSRRHQQWFDNVDSLLSWDCFNQLEDNYWP